MNKNGSSEPYSKIELLGSTMFSPLPSYRMIYKRPLSVVKDEIRLLQIEPSASLESDISCQLLQTPLGSAHSYVALSYCWGDSRIKGKIKIARKGMMVTQNLINALRELRRRNYLYVWADAVCIDQSNLEERSQQVLRMAGIYRSASKVVSFLYCEYPVDARVASALFRRISSADQDVRKAQKDYERRKKKEVKKTLKQHRGSIFASMLRRKQHTVSKPQPPPSLHVNPSAGERKALYRLLFNPYWRRVWIIQEISANTDLEIIWGREVFELDSLIKFAHLAFKDEGMQHTRQLNYLRYIDNIRTAQLDMKPHSILEVISMTRDAKASEPKDKIYAILGVTSNGSILVPFPTYSLSDFAVNRDITIRIIERIRSLDFLLLKKDEVGTWCIDWFNPETFSRRRVESFSRALPRGRPSKRPYNACSKWLAEFEVKTNSISVHGFFMDHIIQCSPTLAETQQGAFGTSRWKEIRRHENTHPYPLKKELAAACRSLRWLLHDVELGDVFGATPPVRSARGLSGSLSLLHKMEGSSSISKELIRWLHCCSMVSFKIGGYHVASWLASNTHWGKQTALSARATIRAAHSNLEHQMRLGTTGKGNLGWFNKNARPGDKIAILSGCRFPAVLRRCGEGGYFVVGEAIVDGLMYGEGVPKENPISIELVNARSVS